MKTILVVDDDAATCLTFKGVLRTAGFACITADNVESALAATESQRVDLAVLDLRLRDGETGLDVFDALRRNRHDLPCAIMTGVWSAESECAALQRGACAVLSKPIWDKTLIAFVQLAAVRAVGSPRTDDRRISELFVLVEERYANSDFTLSAAASRLDISREHLCRLLKKNIGRGFNFVLHSVRVREAKRLLKDCRLSTKEVADRVGYASTSRLDAHFRRHVGTTPTDFRARRSFPRQ